MPALISFVSSVFFAFTSFAICWLFADALKLRFEMKTFLKAIGFGLLGIASILPISAFFLKADLTLVAILLAAFSFFLIFLGFIIDAHSRFQIAVIVVILSLPFLRNHDLLTFQAGLISLVLFQLAYTTKHRDIIPFAIGFILITIAEFFYSLKRYDELQSLVLAGAFLYLFASISLLYWFWSYVRFRFTVPNLERSDLKPEEDL